MKIEQVLIHYLVKKKQLSLQGIGIFLLEGAVAESSDPNKPINIPDGAITFKYDPRASEDQELVDYITEFTGKIHPLASADLDSYLTLGRQFLNIGNPMVIPGIGTIDKTNSGDFIFKGGAHLAEKMEPNKARAEDETDEIPEEKMFGDYSSKPKSRSGQKVLIAIGIIIVGLIIWAIWNYAFNSINEPQNVTEAIYPPVVAGDTTVNERDSTSGTTTDTAAQPAQALATDGYTFKAVVNEYTNLPAAQARLNSLRSYGRKVILFTPDSITYKIAEPFNRPLADTAKIRDSLDTYYGPGKTRIEI